MNENISTGNDVATVSVDIDADLNAVWDALTTEAGLATWMGEGSQLDEEPGGALVLTDVASGRPRFGFVEEFSVGERLSYRWWPTDDPAEVTSVMITLEQIEDSTRVTVVETAPQASASGHATASVAAGRSASWLWRTALLTLAASFVVAR